MDRHKEVNAIDTKSKELWQTIIKVTENMDSEVARSLRISLLVKLQSIRGLKIKRIIKNYLTLGKWAVTASKKSASRVSKDVVFCFPHITPSNMQNLIPVARKAKEKALRCGIITGGYFSEHLKEFADDTSIIPRSELFSFRNDTGRKSYLRDTIKAYNALIHAFDESDPTLSSGLKCYRDEILREVYLSIRVGSSIEHLLRAWKPACVVSTSDFWPFEYQVNYQASRLGIPSFVIQHGITNYFWWPFVSHMYLVWGELFRQEMLQLGTPVNRVRSCGMPATDDIFKKFDETKQRMTVSKPPICLILSQTHGLGFEPELFRQYGILLKKIVMSNASVRWKIKLHPVESDQFYRELGNEVYKKLEIYPKNVTLDQAVGEADFVSTVYSTAGLEAMIMQRPLIVFDISPRVREFAWWPLYGGGTFIGTEQKFTDYVDKITSNGNYSGGILEKQKEFLSAAFENRGCAADAVVNIIERTCAQSNDAHVRS